MPRFASLRPRLENVAPRLSSLAETPGATPRLKGGSAQTRKARWLRYNPLCVECLKNDITRADCEVDHVVPLWKGGKEDVSNLQTLCVDHHREKSKREAADRSKVGY